MGAGASTLGERLDRLVWSVLFPARCLGCGRRGSLLCDACAPGLRKLPADVCPRCASVRMGSGPCRACRRIPPALASMRAACVYEGVARSAVHTLKFRGGRYVAPWMGELLCETLATRPLQADLLVPAPLSPSRLRARGYNQAALLAVQVAPALGATLAPNALARQDRPAQQTLPAAERLHNLRGAVWCAQPEAIKGQRVVVVDDVATTGATLGACAEALTAAGASWVGALVFARDL